VALKVWLELSHGHISDHLDVRINQDEHLNQSRTIGFGTFAAFIPDSHLRDCV
jgi:hypothetical protein